MQRTPHFKQVKCVIVADKKSRCLSFTLTILKNTFGNDVTTKDLTDSGPSINCLNCGFVRRHNCFHFPTPVKVKNVDGSYNQSGTIKFITTLFIRIQGIVH